MVKSGRREAEFTKATRELTARRAGFRCSFPSCDRITVGPSADVDKSSCIGIAAHIYAATAGGPRGSNDLSTEELKSPANAIWLCEDHASLIDKHKGLEYPRELLIGYKALHEARIAREFSGIHAPFGWVKNLIIHSSPLLAEPTEIELARLTLFVGGNSIGKTALCEWLAATTDAHYMKRWSAAKTPRGLDRLSVEVNYLDPMSHSAKVSFLSGSSPKYSLDGAFTAIPTAPLRVIFPGVLRFFPEEKPNDLHRVSTALRLHPYEVLALCEDVSSGGSPYVTHASFHDDDEGCHMFAAVKGGSPLPLQTLSHSECARVLMEFAMLAAGRLAVTRPTILILDSGAWTLDTSWLKRYGELLASTTFGFQTVASMPSRGVDFDELRWAGWKIVWLDGKPPNVTIQTSRPARGIVQ